MPLATTEGVDLPWEIQAAIEAYVADAMRETGTVRGSVVRIEHEPAQVDDPTVHDLKLDDSLLDFASLFDDEAAPPPPPRRRFARGTTPNPTPSAEAESFEEDITAIKLRP